MSCLCRPYCELNRARNRDAHAGISSRRPRSGGTLGSSTTLKAIVKVRYFAETRPSARGGVEVSMRRAAIHPVVSTSRESGGLPRRGELEALQHVEKLGHGERAG
jgi:hypothetical protein